MVQMDSNGKLFISYWDLLIFDEISYKVYAAGNWNKNWSTKYSRMWSKTKLSWFFMTLINTVVSLFEIYKINLIVNDLKKLEPKLKTN